MTSYDREADNEFAEARLTAYAMGELEGQERADVEAEVAASEAARQTVRSIQALANYLREAGRARAVPPSVTLRAAVEARLNQLQGQTAGARENDIETLRVPAVSRIGWQAWVAVAAAACLVIGAVSLYVGERGPHVGPGHQDGAVEGPHLAVAPQGQQPGPQSRVVAGQNSTIPKASSGSRPAERTVADSGRKPGDAARATEPKTSAAPNVPGPRPRQLNPMIAKPESSEPAAPKTGGQTAEPGVFPPRSSVDSIAGQEVPDKPEGKAKSSSRLASSSRSQKKHYTADKPWFLGPRGVTGPVYSSIPEALRGDRPGKTAVPKGPATPVAPGGFGASAVRPGATDGGDGGGPSAGHGGNGGKLSHPSETPLFLPPGMRPDAKSSLPSEAGKSGKAAGKPKPTEPAPEGDAISGVLENPFLPADKFPFSTFSLDVDPEPYFLVDRALREFGHVPRADRVQIEDLVNYFPYDYPEPAADVPFSVSVEAAECPWNSRHRLVRVAIAARHSGPDEAGPQGPAGQKPSLPPIVAKDVRVELEFNPGKVERYRLIGYDDSPTASLGTDGGRQIARDLAAGHAVTALYEVVPAETADRAARKATPSKPHRTVPRDVTAADPSEDTLTVRLEYKRPEAGRYELIQYSATDSGQSFTAASPDFRFAAAVASFGMILRGSQYSGSMTLKTVGEIAAAARGEDRGGLRARFLELVSKAQNLGVGR